MHRDPGTLHEVSKKGYEGDSDEESSETSPIVEKRKTRISLCLLVIICHLLLLCRVYS